MNGNDEPSVGLSRSQAWSLYTLHCLTAWSSRTYEFAAIIFTSSLFPSNLTAASIRGVSTTVACVCFSSALGRWIDASPSRLGSLSMSIWIQQGMTVSSYLLWLLVVDPDSTAAGDTNPLTKAVFAFIILAGIFVKLGSIANNLTTDRQWLPVLAPSSMSKKSSLVQYDLTHLNAVLRRIDLICKIVTPFVFEFWLSISGSPRIVIAVLGAASLVSCAIELKLARFIYASSAALQAVKEDVEKSTSSCDTAATSLVQHRWQSLCAIVKDQHEAVRSYFSSTVWIPSMAWALLHLTVLAYSASLITHMLEVGFSLDLIAVAQSSGTGMEVASTFFTPWIIHWRSRRKEKTEVVAAETDTELPAVGDEGEPSRDSSILEIIGLWGISWQFTCLIPVVIALFYASAATSTTDTTTAPMTSITTKSITTPLSAASLALLTFLSLSRAGYWAYELTTQELTQTLVPAPQLSAFAGVQQSFQSAFELAHWIATAVWARQAQFPWLALGSVGAVGVAAGAYAGWVGRRRWRRWRRRNRRRRGEREVWIAVAGSDEDEDEEEEDEEEEEKKEKEEREERDEAHAEGDETELDETHRFL